MIGFGGMRFDGANDKETNAEVVVHAYNKGINYFDTAPGYGDSEDVFGVAFRQMDRSKFYVSTKSSKSDPAALRSDLETSMKRMGVDCIDFFHIWWVVTLEDWASRVDGGAVAEAFKMKEEGLVKHVVLSSHLHGEGIAQVLSEAPLEGVLLGYCAINFPFRDAGVSAAGERGLGVMTMNPLGGGLIPRNADRFDFLRDTDDPSVVAAALRFNLSNPFITSALVGLTTKQQVDEACAAAENFTPYDDAHVAAIRERIEEKFDGICTGCGYCLPCPKELEIPKYMDAHDQGMLMDDLAVITGRLAMHWKLPPDQILQCNQCGQCEKKCTQHLPITQRLEKVYNAVRDNPLPGS
jgi:predicted aldo/keto reductase-like oxidoreductase